VRFASKGTATPGSGGNGGVFG